ncbi:MAG: 30S ribosomal protein S18 [Chloroflexi bacterium]|nr:30S ribosomal protein S18 [Chloroflexota bacterium]
MTDQMENDEVVSRDGDSGESGYGERRPRRDARPGQDRGGDRPQRRPQRGRFTSRRKICQFCVDKVEHIDYKDIDLLRRFVSEHGKIVARRKTGTCARHQRRLAHAIKRARQIALLPFTADHVRELES